MTEVVTTERFFAQQRKKLDSLCRGHLLHLKK
jgi:hypothetical protein